MPADRATTVQVELGERSYPIVIGAGLLTAPEPWSGLVRAPQILIVTNDTVAPLYEAPLRAALGDRRIETLRLPDGEQHKTLATVARIWDRLMEARYGRDCALVALGGGVIGDMAGFAAACYQRGVDYLQVPSTLLAQVDSSVGGKTAVNHPKGKNMIGAFHQPRLVLADTDTLATLPDRELRAGLAEVIKYGLIADGAFFGWLEDNIEALLAREPRALAHAIRVSCETKARIVAADEREAGRRALLNLGHTFGHAIETATGYGRWLHGEAVGAGMVMAADLSSRIGWLPDSAARRAAALIAAAGLPTRPPESLDPQRFLSLMAMDKKVRDGRLRLVLLREIGAAEVTADVDEADLRATLTAFARAS